MIVSNKIYKLFILESIEIIPHIVLSKLKELNELTIPKHFQLQGDRRYN